MVLVELVLVPLMALLELLILAVAVVVDEMMQQALALAAQVLLFLDYIRKVNDE